MDLSIISFTGKGKALSQNIYKNLSDKAELIIRLYSKCSTDDISETVPINKDSLNENIGSTQIHGGSIAENTGSIKSHESSVDEKAESEINPVKDSIYQWAGEQMKQKKAILFIGAAGIAVRAIAPFITDKLHDSPVLVMDENGKFIIPVLSGHVGGANELACLIADRTGATPVITTATDINNRFAIDVFARKHNFSILNKDGIKKVSSRVLAGEKISISVKEDFIGSISDLPDEVTIAPYPPEKRPDVIITSDLSYMDADLVLVPREYTVGIGCRKGKDTGEIRDFFYRTISAAGILPEQVKCIASIDIKASEDGINSLARELNIPFITFTAEDLNSVEGDFTPSEYVQRITGVDNICERAAMKAAGGNGRLVLPKQKENGMTIAIAAVDSRIYENIK